jgi:hypothetical protein
MTIGLLVLRRSYLKVLGSLIQCALDRGHTAIIFWDRSTSKPGETLRESDFAPWPAVKLIPYDPEQPDRQFLEYRINAVVSTELFLHVNSAGREATYHAARQAGVRFYSVSYIFDTAWNDPRAYHLIERTCYVSEYQRQLHWRLYAERFAEVGSRTRLIAGSAITGSPMLDQLALVDREEVRRRYRLPADRPIVLLMSLKMAVPDPWRRLVWGRGGRVARVLRAFASGHADLIPRIRQGGHYRDLARAVRRFCDRESALLVIKSKPKNGDPPFLRRVADRFVFDDQVYPYTSLELLAISTLCLHFESGAVLEAAFAGIPSISIAVPQSHLAAYPGIDELYGGSPGSLQNYPGVVRRVPEADAIGFLDTASLDRFRIDPAARAAYVQHFLGFDDTRSSHRILDTIERSVQE